MEVVPVEGGWQCAGVVVAVADVMGEEAGGERERVGLSDFGGSWSDVL